jgi:hypothetical protein
VPVFDDHGTEYLAKYAYGEPVTEAIYEPRRAGSGLRRRGPSRSRQQLGGARLRRPSLARASTAIREPISAE